MFKVLAVFALYKSLVWRNTAYAEPLPADWRSRIDPSILWSKESTAANNNLFHGDILLKASGQLSDGASATTVAGQLLPENIWPNGGTAIPFNISESFSPSEKQIIATALQTIERRTLGCITFKPVETETDFLYFQRGLGCNSFVGRQGGKQPINLDHSCMTSGIIQHEILHSLGLFHEQSRPDRDQYVEIFLDNVNQQFLNNFDRLPLMETYNVGYDVESVMHYGAFDFAKDLQRPTIIPRMPGAVKMGQRHAMTILDAAKLMMAYQCRFDDSHSEGDNSNIVVPPENVPLSPHSCPVDIPKGRTIDNCEDDAECQATGRGAVCCPYCGDGRCNRYCRGPGTNGDDLLRADRERSCPVHIPPNRPLDDCREDRDCKRSGRGTMCCAYCGSQGCHRYCRGTGSNGDVLIGGGMSI
ncbi:zinc metalloproteinase nas-15-like [Paramacrobiotus metropolitanus]|uniref:zinc metalloproteinase nas-15-like n=1 Tax=Paramacrobiotus metropolitanus TaxID=2943436 RepID=UPI002445FC1C|nr:zinc metalloproteinase nas-15-like [Paramacrobiotus metropolitanus]